MWLHGFRHKKHYKAIIGLLFMARRAIPLSTRLNLYILVSLARLCVVYVHVVKEVAAFPGAWSIVGVARLSYRPLRPARKIHKGCKAANNCCT